MIYKQCLNNSNAAHHCAAVELLAAETKHALRTYTQSMAKEIGAHNLVVFRHYYGKHVIDINNTIFP